MFVLSCDEVLGMLYSDTEGKKDSSPEVARFILCRKVFTNIYMSCVRQEYTLVPYMPEGKKSFWGKMNNDCVSYLEITITKEKFDELAEVSTDTQDFYNRVWDYQLAIHREFMDKIDKIKINKLRNSLFG